MSEDLPSAVDIDNTSGVENLSETVKADSTGFAVSSDAKTSHDASALVEIKSTEKGMLIPRMTSAERTAISSPATGLLVYNTTNDVFESYSGSAWVEVGSANTQVKSLFNFYTSLLNLAGSTGTETTLASGVRLGFGHIQTNDATAGYHLLHRLETDW